MKTSKRVCALFGYLSLLKACASTKNCTAFQCMWIERFLWIFVFDSNFEFRCLFFRFWCNFYEKHLSRAIEKESIQTSAQMLNGKDAVRSEWISQYLFVYMSICFGLFIASQKRSSSDHCNAPTKWIRLKRHKAAQWKWKQDWKGELRAKCGGSQ